MKKKLPIIISGVAVLTIVASLGFAFRNKIKSQTVKAQEYQIEFTADSISNDDIEYSYENTFAYFIMEEETPKGNTFTTSSVCEVYAGTSLKIKQDGNILSMADNHAGGYWAIDFQFNLSMATFDHVTFLGSFTYGYSNPETTTYLTFNTIDDSGYVNCYFDQINAATITQINVVYHC